MISLLVAYTKDKRVIGAQGKIPWNLPSERNRFKAICRDKYVIMGRKSYDEIGHPLSYCTLVVVSSSKSKMMSQGSSTGTGTTVYCNSLKEAINYCKMQGQEEILVAGGGSIY